MKVPLLDLKAQYAAIKTELDTVVAEVMASQQLILGPQVKACEQAIAQYSGCAHAVGVSSGTDALLICLMAEGIGPGDEVITSPYTFFATAGSIARVGATPVFVDIDPATYNLHVPQIEAKITPRTRAIMPVHLYGQMADMDALMQVAQKHQLVVIEDAAQAVGAEFKGRRAGSIGHYGCFSFFPSKNLGAAGDGGMVVTNDPQRADKLVCLRAHGSRPKYYHKIIGGNFRLDTLQAAVVLAKLRHLDAWTAARQRNAQRYNQLFKETGLPIADSGQYRARPKDAPGLFLPKITASRHIFNQYVIRTTRRDALRAALQARDIGNEIYYPVPLHLQECFAYLGYQTGSLPESESAACETLALPIYPELADDQARYVVQCIAEFMSTH
ncbi:MAG TPA: DegT/DnrJ/EryC1/StrS family aminotransferase [Verrucomicrobiota bacterium]|jgi:dTDP-4-amino-4,6-dideoxygalactose transaminase|nr:DegT/DnrJ/EryC1/StrS family aminotransferase [Verrucomicrobiota bacterium]HQL79908.1 DegT/DnrJ/EryC1/StrS family aminotransferase [Verrucomicrobiota bacterium]